MGQYIIYMSVFTFAVFLRGLAVADDRGCPATLGDVGICGFMCDLVGTVIGESTNICPAGEVCCRTACGGTSCHKPVDDTVCPPDQPTHYCLVDPCANKECGRFINARKVSNYCGGCNCNFYFDDQDVTHECDCPFNETIVQCVDDPCRTKSCSRFPKAVKTADYCGGCNCKFSVEGSDVTESCVCPPDQPTHNCLVDPCANKKCGRFINARKESNYCGGCNCNFYFDDQDVTDECVCPPDQPTHNCLVDPCANKKCGRFINARKEADYCGGCNCKFSVEGSDVTESCDCPSDKPFVQCFDDPCRTESCPRFPKALKTADYCGGCNCKFSVEGSDVTESCVCPPDQPTHNCLVDPCANKKCGRFINARKEPNYCGGCNCNFYFDDQDVTDECDCPFNETIVQCFDDPCRTKSCPRFPKAVKTADYCGGCNCKFSVEGSDVTDSCGEVVCPPDQPTHNCLVDPCANKKCGRFINARKKSNYCGGCNCNFYFDDQDVTDECDCPSNEPFVQCFDDPCRTKGCPRFPKAVKTADYCGGCNCKFSLEGSDVTESCACPPDQPTHNCLVDPCANKGCDRFFNARKESNYCGGCNCNFYFDDQDVTHECDCPFNEPIVQCFDDPCRTKSCPRFPNAVKTADYCGGCNCKFSFEGSDVTESCDCPFNEPIVQCFDDPCRTKSCPRFPKAVKTVDYCGGCNCKFSFEGSDVTESCDCPFNKPIVQCFDDPCRTKSCPRFPKAVKKADYCGGCNCKFSVEGSDVTESCDVECPPDKPMWNCLDDPCKDKKCTRFSIAEKVSNYCGGCTCRFFLGTVDVTSRCNRGFFWGWFSR
ncbi:hypothetical protein ScPMuIL_002911 [Solemya velum]